MFLELLKSGKIVLKRGFAFKGNLPQGSNKEHICIILNKKASENDILNYVYITSQGKEARKRLKYDPKALLTIRQTEYSELNKTSFIQCGKYYVNKISFRELKKYFLDGTYDFNVSNLPSSLVDRLIEAIIDSKTFSTQATKELLS